MKPAVDLEVAQDARQKPDTAPLASRASMFGVGLAILILLGWFTTPVAAQVQCLNNEATWASQVADIESFNTTGGNVAQATEVGSSPGNNAQLGSTLTFDLANTGLSRSFTLQALQSGADLVFNDREIFDSLPDNALSVGDIGNHENDDFEFRFTAGPGLRGFGFFLLENDNNSGESLSVFSSSGSLLGSCTSILDAGSQFIGVITDSAIGRVSFDEDGGGDDIAISNFRFAKRSGDVSISKDDGQTTATPGDTLTYVIQARNNASVEALGAMVSDTFSAPLSGCTWTCSGSSGATCTASGSGDISESVDLPGNSVATFTVMCGTDIAANGPAANTASITPPADLVDTNSTNNSATDTTNLVPQTDLSLGKDDGVTQINADSDVTYTLTINNLGPLDSTGGSVVDTLPSGFTFVSSASGCSAAGSTVTCTFASLTLGSSNSLSFVAHADASVSGNITNSATVTGNELDSNSGNDTSSHDTLVVAQTDLALTKLDTPDPVVAGAQLTYTMTVTNNGPSASTGGTVSDTLPNGLAFASSGDCTDGGAGTVTCPFGNLASGSSQMLQFIVDVDEDSSGTVTNSASVAGSEDDPVSGNNTANATTEIIRQADLQVIKVDNSGGTVVAGTSIDYSVTVNNLGPNDVLSAVVSDTFPTALDNIRWTCTASPGSSCDAVGSSNINDAVNLLAGGSVVYSIEADVESDVQGTMINQASASNPAGTEDPDLSNNSDAVTTQVIRQADLRLDKEDASGGETVPGGTLSYRLTVTNDGPSDSSGGTVSDTLPAGTTFRGSASGCTAVGTTVTCAFANLTRNSQRTLIFTVEVDAGTTGTLTNTATVSGTDPDPDNGNNSASRDTLTTPQTDLELDKNGPTTSSSGENLTYTLEITNFGPSDSSGSTVQDVLPEGLTFVASADCSAVTNTVTCTVGSIAAGASRSSSFDVLVGSEVSTSIFNTAELTTNEEDLISGNNTATHLTTVDAMADLTLSKSGSANVVAGETLTYTLTVSNNGPADATLGSVLDTLPNGLSFVSSADGCSGVSGAVVCPFDSLEAGTSLSLAFVARVGPEVDTSITNAATVEANEPDPDGSNNDASLTTAVSRSADLALSKNGGVDVVTPGGPLEYILTVRNLGPSAASGGQVTDFLPSGSTFTTSPDGCAPSGGNVICPFGPLAIDEEIDLRFTTTVSANVTTPLLNTAAVSGNESDPQASNNQASLTTPLTISADLALSKDDGVSEVVAGTPLTYTLTVSNLGPSAASGGVVTDTLPSGLSFATSADGCTVSTSGASEETVSCPFSTLAAGSSHNLTFVVDVASDNAGTIDNQATVVGNDSDLDPSNDNASHQTPVIHRTDLALSKDDGVASQAPGEELTYTLTVSNAGPSDLLNSSDVTLSDVLPTGIVFRRSDDGCAVEDTSAGSTVTCPVPPLADGASIDLSFDVRIDPDLTGSVVNTAQVTADAIDPVAGNNTASHTTPLTPAADLAIEKTDNLDQTSPGAAHTYTLTVRNLGPSDDPAVTVNDTLPNDLIDVTWSCQASPGSSCSASGSSNINDTVQLAADGVLVYTIDSTVSGTVGGMLNNTATVSGSLADPDLGNNSASDSTDLEAIADLRLSKDDGQTAVNPGTQLTYTLTVENLGPSDVLGATVTDSFPPALTNVAWTCVAGAGASCIASGFGDINESVSLSSGSQVTFTAVATVAADAVGLLANSAQVVPPAGVLDPDLSNNSSTDIDTLDPSADLLLLKTDGQDSAAPGQTLTYDLTVRNLGPGDAAGARVVDLLPDALQAVTWICTPSAGSVCTPSGNGDLIDTVAIPAGGQLLYQLSGVVDPAAQGSLINTASVASAPGLDDPAPSNNSASDIDTLEAQHDLVISKTDGVLNVTPGSFLTYTVSVQNLGPSTASGPQVYDPLPEGLTCVWTCQASSGASCLSNQLAGDLLDHPVLPATSTAVYTGLCQLAADFDGAASGGQLVNSASVSAPAGSVDPQPLNNTASDVDTLSPLADLAVSKTDGVTEAIPGQSTLTYVLSAQNIGPSHVVGAQLSDTFPAGLDCVWSCSAGAGTSCPAGQQSGDLAALVNLEVGSSLVINASCEIAPDLSGTLDNTLSITPPSGTSDPNPNNNTASDVDTVLQPTVQLVVSKTDSLDQLAPGESLTYQVTVRNDGPSDAIGITVTDLMPTVLDNITWSCDATAGSTCSALGSDDIIDLVTVRSGGLLTYTIQALVRADASAGVLTNSANVSLPSGVVDSHPDDNSASDVTQLIPVVDLAISKDDGVTTAVPGTSLSYTVAVTNSGPSDSIDARVVDQLPAQLSGVTWSCLPSPGAQCTLLGSGTLDDTVRLPVGGQLVYTLDATITADADLTSDPAAELLNTATVHPAEGVEDSDPNNNSASDLDMLSPRADLRLSKTDDRLSVAPGGRLTYTLELYNDGPSDVVGVLVEDPFPNELTCAWSCLANLGAQCGVAGPLEGDLVDTVDLPVDSFVTYSADCQVDAAATGSILNTASVTLPDGVEDPDLDNNTAADSTDLDARADLVISKNDGRNSATPGEILTYTLVVSNPFGPSDVSGAIVEDVFPTPLSCVWGCQGHFGASCTPGQVSGDLFDVIDLPVGSQAIYTALCTLDDAATGSVVNGAKVTMPVGFTDSNLSNNAANDVTDIASAVDLAITVSDGTTGAAPGESLTYVVVARQLSGPPTSGVTIRDAFPSDLECLWTCQAVAGGSCAAGQHAGDLFDVVSLVSGASLRYTAICDIAPDAAVTPGEVLSNTATIEPASGVDANPADNSSTDLDTVLLPQADLTISKTDGLTLVGPGAQLTYDIVVSNVEGPSTAVNATVEDLFPSELDCDWTCDLSGDATCTAGPVDGDLIDTVTLPPGERLVYTASCELAADASDPLTNTARVIAPDGFDDPVPGNNVASDTTAIENVTDLALQLDDGTSSAAPGGTLTYNLRVDNFDTFLAFGPKRLLFLPATAVRGLVVRATTAADLSCQWTCQPSDGASCEMAPASGDLLDSIDLPAGGQVIYTAVCDIASGATDIVTTTAELVLPTGVIDIDLSNNTDSDSTSLVPQADLRLSKSDGVTAAAAGGEVIYVIEASNDTGPSDVLGARVIDTFAASLDCLTSCQSNQGASCSGGLVAGDLDQTVDLPVGSQVIFTAMCRIAPSANGMLSNTASLIVPNGVDDPDLTNNTASDLDTALLAMADLSLSKNDGRTEATPGGEISYSLVARNAGPSNVSDAQVIDDLPDSLTCTWTCGSLGGASCDPGPLHGDLATSVDLPAGSSVVFNAACLIDPAARGTLVNSASLTPPGDSVDPNLDNNLASDDDTLLRPSSDLSLGLDNGQSETVPGSQTTYSLRLDNLGLSNTQGIHLATTEPPTMSCVWSCTPDPGTTCQSGPTAGPLNAIVDLPTGLGVTYSGVCQVLSSATGSLQLDASVTLSADTEDPNPDNNLATDIDTLTPRADLSISKDDGVDEVAPGDSLTYTLVVHNAGPSDAPQSVVHDPFPSDLSCTWTCSPASGAQCTPGPQSGDLSDTVHLPAASSITYEALCDVATMASGLLTNQADVTPAASVVDGSPANNSDSDSDTVTPRADLSISKDDGQTTVQPGDTLTYAIVVGNAGPSDAADVTVEDLFPAQLACTWTCDSPSSGCTAGPVSGDLNDLLDLPASTEVTYSAVCQLANDALGNVTNTASISVADGLDPNLSNNSSTDIDVVGTMADLEVTVVDEPDPVAPGEILAYGVEVINHGPASESSVTLTGLLPGQVTFLGLGGQPPGLLFLDGFESGDVSRWDNTVSAGSQKVGTDEHQVSGDLHSGDAQYRGGSKSGNDVQCSESGGTLTCQLGMLADGDRRDVVILVRVADDASGVLIHTLTVNGQGEDPDSSNNSASAITNIGSTASDASSMAIARTNDRDSLRFDTSQSPSTRRTDDAGSLR